MSKYDQTQHSDVTDKLTFTDFNMHSAESISFQFMEERKLTLGNEEVYLPTGGLMHDLEDPDATFFIVNPDTEEVTSEKMSYAVFANIVKSLYLHLGAIRDVEEANYAASIAEVPTD